eukprot:4086368-Prorocentrum_lima.AAC.1
MQAWGTWKGQPQAAPRQPLEASHRWPPGTHRNGQSQGAPSQPSQPQQRTWDARGEDMSKPP